jgi:sterol desaturase/sphingolipid hydroxylase (fatty acid hydroxylase superfamily)
MNEWIAARSYLELLALCAGVCVALTLIGLGAGYGAERFWWKRGRKVFDLPLKRGQVQKELIGTALFHLMFIPVAALALRYGGVRFASGIAAELVGFAGPWYAFQLYYYVFHRSMHSRALFWMHRWHHESLVTTPMTGFSMHPAEAVGWIVGIVGSLVLFAQLDLLGFWGFSVFFFSLWSGNIAGHANAELMPLRSTRLTTLLSSNPISYHSLHHARFDGHYGFVAATMDWLFKTEFPDWKAIHDRVFDGKPLKSLREKG